MAPPVIVRPASRNLLLWFAAAALLLRLLMPAGFMPGTGGTLVLCTGAGPVTVSDHGGPVKAPLAPDAGGICAFAAVADAGPLPQLVTVLLPLLLALVVLHRVHGLQLGVGLGTPPQPSTGPPLKI